MVSVNGVLSKSTEVTSGVPQGSVLGPLLFIILMLGIGAGLQNCTYNSFADDTKLMAMIHSCTDAQNFQNDLNTIYEWAKTESNMMYNSEKFQLLRYGINVDLKEATAYTDSTGKPITVVNTAKDLGVLMSSSCTFDIHTKKVIQTCNFTIAQILRLFSDRSQGVMMTLFNSLVRSKIDYCSILVSPTTTSLRMSLERVQRSFTKKITGMHELSYWDRLKKLRIQSLERRHERYCILYVVKIILGLVPNFGLKWHLNERTGIHLTVPLIPSVSNSKAYTRNLISNSPKYRMSRLFNALPIELRWPPSCDLADPISSYKTALDHYLATIPDQPTDYSQQRAAASNSIIDQRFYTS
jgi:hypothetical protein